MKNKRIFFFFKKGNNSNTSVWWFKTILVWALSHIGFEAVMINILGLKLCLRVSL